MLIVALYWCFAPVHRDDSSHERHPTNKHWRCSHAYQLFCKRPKEVNRDVSLVILTLVSWNHLTRVCYFVSDVTRAEEVGVAVVIVDASFSAFSRRNHRLIVTRRCEDICRSGPFRSLLYTCFSPRLCGELFDISETDDCHGEKSERRSMISCMCVVIVTRQKISTARTRRKSRHALRATTNEIKVSLIDISSNQTFRSFYVQIITNRSHLTSNNGAQ